VKTRNAENMYQFAFLDLSKTCLKVYALLAFRQQNLTNCWTNWFQRVFKHLLTSCSLITSGDSELCWFRSLFCYCWKW